MTKLSIGRITTVQIETTTEGQFVRFQLLCRKGSTYETIEFVLSSSLATGILEKLRHLHENFGWQAQIPDHLTTQ